MLNDKVRRCNHIKTNGIQCGSPALRGYDVCHFHQQAKRDFPRRKSAQQIPETVIDLALIDDPDGIHYALMQVTQGLLNGTLNHKSAGLTIQALQIMSSNFKRTSFQRQLESEFRKSELNAYQLWDKMEKEAEEEAATRLHQKRIEEIKRLEQTCHKCKKLTVEPASSAPPNALARTAGDPPAVDAGAPHASEPPTPPLTIHACAVPVPVPDADFPFSRFSDFPFSRSSTLKQPLCDPDSLPSSGGPTRASQRC